jgi:hypothetical protein
MPRVRPGGLLMAPLEQLLALALEIEAHGPKSVILLIDFRKSSRTILEGKHPDPEETTRWISPSTT